jgi:lipoate-protein ligase A
MAVDEAIARSVGEGKAPPTLRLYAWEPGCLSLGRGQKATDVDRAAVEASIYGLVRRPTGGKAILHVDELTYSISAPRSDPRMEGRVTESYRKLSRGLVRGLQLLGVEDIVADERAESRLEGPVCFEVPSNYEIAIDGQKLVGSAQMRASGAVLQHGAVPLYGDIARICSLLADHPDPERVRARATTVEAVLGRRVTWNEAADALTQGFSEALNLRLEVGELTPVEEERARALQAKKYSTDDWTERV